MAGDLWTTTVADRATIAQMDARRLGTNVRHVEHLTTGLWMYWIDADGESHYVSEMTARQILMGAKALVKELTS